MKILLLFLLLFSTIKAEVYVVIIAKSCDGINTLNLKEIYLKKQKSNSNCTLVPLNFQANNKIREIFVQNQLNISNSKWSRYWDKMHFKGVKAPYIVSSNEAMLAYITQVPGAIGYLPKAIVQNSTHHHSLQIVSQFQSH
jgi:hypothetical protein